MLLGVLNISRAAYRAQHIALLFGQSFGDALEIDVASEGIRLRKSWMHRESPAGARRVRGPARTL